jgi:hypothetical protein
MNHPLAILNVYALEPPRSAFPVSIEKQWGPETAVPGSPLSSRAALIPEPEGEMGRPGRGGYSLQQELLWSPDLYKTVRVQTSTLSHRFCEL